MGRYHIIESRILHTLRNYSISAMAIILELRMNLGLHYILSERFISVIRYISSLEQGNCPVIVVTMIEKLSLTNPKRQYRLYWYSYQTLCWATHALIISI